MTAYLADTQIVLWAAAAPERLANRVRDVIADPSTTVLVSAVSIAEMAIKQSIGKLTLPVTPLELCAAMAFDVVPLEPVHAQLVGELPLHHRDPFDRLLIAHALSDSVTLISADPSMTRYGVALLTND